MCALTCVVDQQDNVDIIDTEKTQLNKVGRHKDNIDEIEQLEINVLKKMSNNGTSDHNTSTEQKHNEGTGREYSSGEEDDETTGNATVRTNYGETDKCGSVSLAVNLSLIVNIILLITKIIVFVMTWSLAVIASLVDSVLDLLSQFIIWLTERKVNRKNDHKYPVGKTRLEPVGILTVSILMIMLSVTVIRESIQSLITQSAALEWSLIGIILLAGMYIVCTYMDITKFRCRKHIQMINIYNSCNRA